MYSDNDLRNIVINVSNLPDGLDFIFYLLDTFGTFAPSINISNTDTANIIRAVKKEQGEFILELLREYNFEKFTEIHEKRRNEKCQKTMN